MVGIASAVQSTAWEARAGPRGRTCLYVESMCRLEEQLLPAAGPPGPISIQRPMMMISGVIMCEVNAFGIPTHSL